MYLDHEYAGGLRCRQKHEAACIAGMVITRSAVDTVEMATIPRPPTEQLPYDSHIAPVELWGDGLLWGRCGSHKGVVLGEWAPLSR